MSKFILPADWDSPSKENEELCKRFTPAWADGSLMYRLFTPETDRGTIPLVVFLHGADAFGNDNISQISMHEIGTMFARDEWQKPEPCYIVCPQCTGRMHWSQEAMQEKVFDLVNKLIEKASHTDTQIDKSRIYIYGYSAGAIGSLQIMKSYPGFFAGAILICGATGRGGIENLLQTPMWLVHAADDRIVKVTYEESAPQGITYYLGSRDISTLLREMHHSDLHFTEYPEGYMKDNYSLNPHCTWVCVSGDEGNPIRKWLFEKKKPPEHSVSEGLS